MACQLLKRKIESAMTRIDLCFHSLLYVSVNYSRDAICVEVTPHNVAVKFKLDRLQILLGISAPNRYALSNNDQNIKLAPYVLKNLNRAMWYKVNRLDSSKMKGSKRLAVRV